MDSEARRAFEAEWLDRYGAPLSSLSVVRPTVEGLRAVEGDCRRWLDLAALLERHAMELRAYTDGAARGSSVSPRSQAETALAAGFRVQVHALALALGRAEENERDARHLRLMTDWVHLPELASRAPDTLGCCALVTAEWIRARRNDGKTSWRDVVHCLLYFGHDLSHIGGSREEAIRQAANRARSKASRKAVESVRIPSESA